MVEVIVITNHTYLAASGKLEEQASNGGSKQLSNPIQNAPQEADIPPDKRTKSHSRVDVAARDVGRDANPHEQAESMGQRGGHQPGWGGGAVVGEKVEGHAGAFSGKDENECADKLGQSGPEGVRVVRFFVSPDRNFTDRHCSGGLLTGRWWGWSSY